MSAMKTCAVLGTALAVHLVPVAACSDAPTTVHQANRSVLIEIFSTTD
jgi:hypothetical protein